MAGPRTCQSPRNNPPLTGEDELARDAPGAPTKGSNTLIPSPAISSTQTPAPAQTPALAQTPAPAQAPAPTPGPPGMYTDVDLQRATRLALESFVKG